MDIACLWSRRKIERRNEVSDTQKLAWWYHQATMLLRTVPELTTRLYCWTRTIVQDINLRQSPSVAVRDQDKDKTTLYSCLWTLSKSQKKPTFPYLDWCDYCFFVNYKHSFILTFPPTLDLLRYPVTELFLLSDSIQPCFLPSTEGYHLRQAQILCFLTCLVNIHSPSLQGAINPAQLQV